MDITVTRQGNEWVFSTGERLPVVSGGSDPGPLQLPTSDPPANDPPVSDPDSLANDFLKNVPDTDRAVVEKYIKDWDAGVTKKFQSIHEQYSPYKELGEVTDIQQAIQLQELLESEPEYVYNMLAQEFGGDQQQQQKQQQQLPPEFEGLPPEFMEKFNQQQTMLESLAQLVLDGRQQNVADEEDKALETELGRLKKAHGEFDEEFVLSKMWHGASGDDAVKAYQTLTQSIINGQQKPKPQPPGLFGGGVIPTDNPDVGKMESKDVRSLVANILAKAGQDT